jgi:hypothetical protein
MTDVDLLTRAGRLLYGDWWHTRMSVSLGVSRKTVQRWSTGEFHIPAGVWADIRVLLLARIREQTELAAVLQRMDMAA